MTEQCFELLKTGSYREAIGELSEALVSMPDDAQLYRARGIAFFSLAEWKPAIADFKKARELAFDNPSNWLDLALCLIRDERIYEAIDTYEYLLVNKPGCIPAYLQLASLYYHLGAIGKGHATLDSALKQMMIPEEREKILALKREQQLLDKKRYYRPDFEALNNKPAGAKAGIIKRIKAKILGV